MIGIGSWECNVSTVFFKGKVHIDIADNGGKYSFAVSVDGKQVNSYRITSISQQGTDTLVATGFANAMPNKTVTLTVKFTSENTFEASVKIPLLGNVKTSGYRV